MPRAPSIRSLRCVAAVAVVTLALGGGARADTTTVTSAPPASEHAHVRRYALLVGSNQGRAHETPLRFAETDVDAVADTLTAVGGYDSERVVRLKAPTAERVRNALVDLNLTIQRDVRAGAEAVLFVYISGHGDGASMHFGATALPTDELGKLVRLAPARLKILLLDSCRSGALTRVKGGHPVAPFQIGLDEELRNEGFAIITSSAAGEDAQESDDLRSSIFTHHFLAALRGAGDANRDGVVTLGESYAYAYEQALETSLASIAGSQHATFDYDLRGRADPVLADLRNHADAAWLSFASPGEYLIMTDGNRLAWEAAVGERGAALLVPAGHYLVRLRTRSNVYETDLALGAGESRALDVRAMRPVPLAQVVRKGESQARWALGPSVFGAVHGPLADNFSPMMGAQAAFAFEWPNVSLMPRLGFGAGSVRALPDGVRSNDLTEMTFEVAALYPLDVGRLTLAPLVSLGAAVLWQTIDRTDGCDPAACRYTRSPKALVTSVGALASWPIHAGVSADAAVELVSFYLGRQTDAQNVNGAATRSGTLTYRASLGLGYRY